MIGAVAQRPFPSNGGSADDEDEIADVRFVSGGDGFGGAALARLEVTDRARIGSLTEGARSVPTAAEDH